MVSSPALAGVVWRGDFETGDRSQYSGAQMVSADRLQVVTSPLALSLRSQQVWYDLGS
jgi:hypothetical protein